MSSNVRLIRLLLYIIEVFAAFKVETITSCTLRHCANEHQHNVNDFWSSLLWNHTADRLQSVIKPFLASSIGKTDCNTPPAVSWKWGSREHKQFLVMRASQSHRRQVVFSPKENPGRLYRQTRLHYPHCPILKRSVNGASTIVGHESWVIWGSTRCTVSYMDHWLPL